jgi:hypothetical protein
VIEIRALTPAGWQVWRELRLAALVPPEAERQFAALMGATTVEIPSSHVAMVSHPDEVVDLIKSAAQAVPVRPDPLSRSRNECRAVPAIGGNGPAQPERPVKTQMPGPLVTTTFP